MTKLDEKKLIAQFGEAMQKKLDLRSNKGRMGFRKKTLIELWYGLMSEVAELGYEIGVGNMENIKGESVDVGNSSMFLFDYANRSIYKKVSKG